jgi:hypothetical protein
MTKYRALAEKLYQNLRWSRSLSEELRKKIESYEDVITREIENTLRTWDE